MKKWTLIFNIGLVLATLVFLFIAPSYIAIMACLFSIVNLNAARVMDYVEDRKHLADQKRLDELSDRLDKLGVEFQKLNAAMTFSKSRTG